MVKPQFQKKSYSKYHVYQPVWPDMRDWPIYKLSKNRSAFVKLLEEYIFDKLREKNPKQLYEVIAKTAYLERIRVKEEPWKVDLPNDKQYWSKVKKSLLDINVESEEKEAKEKLESILKGIVHRYAEEIVGTFNINTFLFARRFLTFFFNLLLNTTVWLRKLSSLGSKKFKLHNRLHVTGEVDSIRNLMKKGTVVLVPTHFSNIDSVFVGYVMDAVLGLPSFSYGAGLNLYNSGIAAYFMNRLGAYRVDRRKKNPIYLETLKGMSKLSLEEGVNSLFFPGGTRSRSGALEKRIKMGLLGSVVSAQRELIQKGSDKRIFIFPVVMGYHFVLEAKYLIEQHLIRQGRENYIRTKDHSYSIRKVLRFAWNFLSNSSDFALTIGRPIDIAGNFVGRNGESLDQLGNEIDIADYFRKDGIVSKDYQREQVYTRLLADRIAERYKEENYVLSSHLVAFAGFQLLKAEHPDLDLYALLRLPPEDYSFSTESMHNALDQLKVELFKMEKENKIRLSEEIKWPNKELLLHGISMMGSYHALQPLMIDKKYQLIVSEDFKLLHYYHNRLSGYKLEDSLKLT